MKNLLAYSAMLASLLAFTSCAESTAASASSTIASASSSTTSKTITVANFSEINAANGVNINWTQGKLSAVIVNAPADIMPYIEVEVKGDELYAKISEKYYKKKMKGKNGLSINPDEKTKNVKITVSSPSITEIDITTASTFTVSGSLELSGKLSIDATTSAKVIIPTLSAGELDADIQTSALLSIKSATITDADLESSTSGLIDIATLNAANVEAEASTSGKIKITAGKCGFLKADASTSGTLLAPKFKATKAKVEASTSGTIDYNSPSSTESNSKYTGGSIKNHN